VFVAVDELFAATQITPTGTANWGEKISERGRGVYVISIADPSFIQVDSLPECERKFWNPDQSIIYIGRAVQLQRRMAQFYRHQYGNSSPHRGGQAILKVNCPRRIDWAAVEDHAAAEHALIAAFEARAGVRPFGNRVRSARFSQI